MRRPWHQWAIFVLPLCFLFCGTAHGQSSNPVRIDARQTFYSAQDTSYRGGTSLAPDGRQLSVNAQFMTLAGRPGLPTMGEMHYSRVPESEWAQELRKMKAAGIQIVATYVFWIHHEEMEGQFDWSGQRDLHRFIELCRQNGLYVVVRIGPWAHGEARNGGSPDWLLTKGPTRRNEPAYMSFVDRFYTQIAAQLRGELWKEGGPVIGIQIENEFAGRGPNQGNEYILALKRMALQKGLDVPLYTVTGWDNAVVPRGEVLPVYGGYPDAPWDASTTDLPPSEVYQFRFSSRVAGNMGMIGNATGAARAESSTSDTPFITAEMGGGVQVTYHRRPVVQPDDVAAMMPVMLGSGVNLYGTYMFHGGENPEGKRTTLQESQATGYPTDVPTKSYDFQAPLGEFGQERASLRKLKIFNYFLQDFGEVLAPMTAHAPEQTPSSPADLQTLRAAVRSKDDQGFLFVNNYVRNANMPVHNAVQFEVKLAHEVLRFPDAPVDIPSGAYFIWPLNFNLGPFRMRYSTAQLFMRLSTAHGEAYVFQATQGIAPEFVFADDAGMMIHAPGARLSRHDGWITVSEIHTGFSHSIRVKAKNGAEVTVIVLTRDEAENSWRARIGTKDHLVHTNSSFYALRDGFVLENPGTPRCAFDIYPAPGSALHLRHGDLRVAKGGANPHYVMHGPEQRFRLQAKQIKSADPAPEPVFGAHFSWRPQGIVMAPDEKEYRRAAKWEIAVNGNFKSSLLSNVYLKLDYVGDTATLSTQGKLLEDDFYMGVPWQASLRRFASDATRQKFELGILPLRKGAPIFLEKQFWPNFGTEAQAASVRDLSVVPVYKFVLTSRQHTEQDE